MYIAMVSAECAPVAKAGGLGDFIHGLSRELALRGHRVEVLLPKYDSLRYDLIEDLRPGHQDLQVPYFDEIVPCRVDQGLVDGVECLFIDPRSSHAFFERGHIYGEGDDDARFALFCRAVLEFLSQSGRRPDILHCHDWQTGLIPVLLWEVFEGLVQGPGMGDTRTLYTLHNLGHQGWVTEAVLRQVGLSPQRLITPDRLQDSGNPRGVNLLKGGIVFSNFVTTVSPRYAWEVQNTEQGMGLQGLLRQYDSKFAGVLNGIDTAVWNPLSDRHLAQPYGPETLPHKALNKTALRRRLGLQDSGKPVLCVVSRLDRQKGVDLIRHGIDHALDQGCQVVLLGSAQEPSVAEAFRRMQERLGPNPDAHLELAYDEELSHQIYGGADMILIPSVYEPCGLTQLIAMKYGVVPIVRRVGGLADTVFDANYSDRPFKERNGYTFDDLTVTAQDHAMDRAIGLWYQYPDYFRQLRLNGMVADHSWGVPAARYLDIYHHLHP
jgi:starch synthase